MTNLAANLTASATAHPDRPAIRLDELILSYTDLDRAVDRAAAMLLERGLEPGNRVAMMLPNIPAFAVAFYGVLRAGGVVVPMNPLFKDREVEYYLTDSGAKLLIAWHQVGEAAGKGAASAGVDVLLVEGAAAADFPGIQTSTEGLGGRLGGANRAREDADTAVILYTSGTTGRPKGAQLTHANLNANQEISARTLLQLDPDQVIMGCLPLFHVFGLTCALNASIAAGSCVTLLPRFDPATAREIMERDHVTIFVGVPTMYSALLQHHDPDRDLSRLRSCISGGASLPVEVMSAFERTFGCMILEGYGLSETSPVASFNRPDIERKAGSIGVPIEGVEMRLISPDREVLGTEEVGEIQIRGHNVMTGYWQRPEATAEAIDDEGWFSSGDLARRDADGYYFIVDRKKDLIIRGGYNVYPREVEEVLYEHPAVAEVAVIGLPHPELGEEIAAAVALKPGQQAAPEDLIAFVKERLAAYKYPRQVWVVDSLPKTATGKILRREVTPPQA